MDKHQLPVFDRQSVIYHNVYPFAKLPELQDGGIIKKKSVNWLVLHLKGRGREEDNRRIPESGRFQHSHPERTARVGQPDEEASHSVWERRWLPGASSHLPMRGSIGQPLSISVVLLLERFHISISNISSPSAPWQMSVLVAPSTINWGSSVSSYGEIKCLGEDKSENSQNAAPSSYLWSTSRPHLFQPVPNLVSVCQTAMC